MVGSLMHFLHQWPDDVADLFLQFSHLGVIFVILVLGFLKLDRRVFFQAACLCAIDLVVNVALKGTFKVPLSPSLHKIGYAFPSGHMQLSTVLYVWLAFCFAYWSLRAVVCCLLLGIAAGLIHYGYHDVYEVIGGFLCGMALIYVFQMSLKHLAAYAPWLWLACTSVLMTYNVVIYTAVPMHAWQAYGVLLGLTLLERGMCRRNHGVSGWVARVR